MFFAVGAHILQKKYGSMTKRNGNRSFFGPFNNLLIPKASF